MAGPREGVSDCKGESWKEPLNRSFELWNVVRGELWAVGDGLTAFDVGEICFDDLSREDNTSPDVFTVK